MISIVLYHWYRTHCQCYKYDNIVARYVLVPLGGAVVMAWAYVCMRKAGTAVSSIVVSFYLLFFQMIGGAIYQVCIISAL